MDQLKAEIPFLNFDGVDETDVRRLSCNSVSNEEQLYVILL